MAAENEKQGKPRKLIPCIYMLKGKAVTGFGQKNLFGDGDPVALAEAYSNAGADSLLVFDFSGSESEHAEAIEHIRRICRISQVPVLCAGHIESADDVRRLLRAGCSVAVLNGGKAANLALLPELSRRYGKKQLAVSLADKEEFDENKAVIEENAGLLLLLDDQDKAILSETALDVCIHTNETDREALFALLKEEGLCGVSGAIVSAQDTDLVELKVSAESAGIPTEIPVSRIDWKYFKLNSDGLIPVIVQDIETDEVLMLAYMNEESYNRTLVTGKMCYWSRSRSELWTKGETSGHYQYVKSLTIDCDKDTILARVRQIGAACHTGHHNCFFTPLMKKEYRQEPAARVIENSMKHIRSRKETPKEGSYTSSLFEKGTDKILRRLGACTADLLVCGSSSDRDRIKTKIATLCYHILVLMTQLDISASDIASERVEKNG